MKKGAFILLVTILGLFACKNANQKEIGEVDSLLSIVDETEKALLSVDTSRAYAAKRLVDQDMKLIKSIGDTLNREQAFKLDDYYAGKKKIFRFSTNYMTYISQLNFTRKQLQNLKQDLTNGLVSKENYKQYYSMEQATVMELSSKVNKSVGGIDEAMLKLETEREAVLEIFEELKQNSSTNGE